MESAGAWPPDPASAWDMGEVTFAQVPRENFNRRWIDSRRGGGGGGDPIAKPLAVLMLMLAGLSVVASFTKQSNVNASLLAGCIFGYFMLNERADTKLSGEVIKTFTEFGITFVLFFAGLSIDFQRIYLTRLVPLAFWFQVMVSAFISAVAYGIGLVETTSAITLIGISCSLCSKILLHEHLHGRNEQRSMHGMAVMCISWVQDLVLLVCLAVIQGYKNSLTDMDCPAAAAVPSNSTGPNKMRAETGSTSLCSRRAKLGSGASNVKFGPPWPPQFNEHDLGDNIGIALLTLGLVIFIHWLLKKYLLRIALRFFLKEGELLFFFVMAYSLGTCALSYQARFSSVVSAYLSGYALCDLPGRLQVQQKIASLRAFGTFLFHFMLGIYVQLNPEFFENRFRWTLLLSFLIAVVNPIFMLVLGRWFRILPKTSINLAMLSNNVGEHALILASLAYHAGIFEFKILQIMVTVAQLTMLVAALVLRFMKEIDVLLDRHSWLSSALSKSDEKLEIARLNEFTWKNHVVIVGFNETALEIAELFREQQQDVVVIDLDWRLHKVLQRTFKDAHRGLDQDQSVRAPTNFSPPQRFLEQAFSRDLSRQPMSIFPGQSTMYHMVGTAFGAAGAAEEEEPEGYLAGGTSYGTIHAHVRAHGQYMPMSEPESAPMPMQSPMADSMLMSNGSKVVSSLGYFNNTKATPSPIHKVPMPIGSGPPETTSSFRKKKFLVDGNIFGGGTNIFSVYADPESMKTWNRFKFKEAALVLSCMNEDRSSKPLCEYMRSSNTPLIVLCTSNVISKELYEAGADYVVQQDYLTSKEMAAVIEDQMGPHVTAGERFEKLREKHLQELKEESSDHVLAEIGRFI